MSGRCLRQRPPISYYEPDEPNLDEYVYCDKCGDLVYEYCSIHGPLLVVPDNKVPIKPNVPSYVPRAALTIPDVFLHLATSSIPEAGVGVFSTLTLPAGVRFGPYTGEKTDGVDSYYCWQIYDNNRKPSYCIDASNASISNWMRYVNCARHWTEQNLVAFQYKGQLYYRTIKIIPRCTELLVFYGSEFANELDIDLGKYNSPIYARVYSVADKNRKLNDEDPKLTQELRTRKPILKDTDNTTETRNKNVEITFTNNNDSIDAFITKDNTEQNGDISEHLNVKNGKSRIDIQTNLIQFVCDTCNEKFIFKNDLEKHMRFHDKNRIYDCNHCTYRFTSACRLTYHKYSKHQINDHNLKIHACDICDKTFSQINVLKKHLRVHTGEKPFVCGTCNAKFTEKSSLQNHFRTHTGEKPFVCGTCNAKFTEKSSLRNHFRTHTGEKPFVCGTCNAKFARKDSLQSHFRTHTGEKPYSCGICNSKFSNKGYLKIHNRIHTGEKPFVCGTCNAKFTRKDSLRSHENSHRSMCDLKFSRDK